MHDHITLKQELKTSRKRVQIAKYKPNTFAASTYNGKERNRMTKIEK